MTDPLTPDPRSVGEEILLIEAPIAPPDLLRIVGPDQKLMVRIHGDPWVVEYGENVTLDDAATTFWTAIVEWGDNLLKEARTRADAEHSALLAAEARIAAVRELHNAVGLGAPCRSCRPYTPYPCPTIQALTEGGSDD